MTDPQQFEVMKLEGYGWPMCSKQPWRVHRRLDVVNKLDRRGKSRFNDLVAEESTLIFGDNQISCVLV